MHPSLNRRGLYAITDGPREDLVTAAAAALRGGAVLLQYRDKTTDAPRRLREARALREICAHHAVPLIINDDVELALMAGAAGVHLGEDDGDVAAARARLGAAAIIGVSCYDSLARAQQMATAGVDYLAFGAFFPSSTKRHARRASLDVLRDAKSFGLPRVAIGGITPDNAAALLAAGADFLAVISGLFGKGDPCAAAKKYTERFVATDAANDRGCQQKPEAGS